LRRILQRYGYTYEGNKVMKGDGDGPVATETPNKDTAPKKQKEKATPASKKRKLGKETNGEEIDDGDVKEEVE
jgi:hypothetical protein